MEFLLLNLLNLFVIQVNKGVCKRKPYVDHVCSRMQPYANRTYRMQTMYTAVYSRMQTVCRPCMQLCATMYENRMQTMYAEHICSRMQTVCRPCMQPYADYVYSRMQPYADRVYNRMQTVCRPLCNHGHWSQRGPNRN